MFVFFFCFFSLLLWDTGSFCIQRARQIQALTFIPLDQRPASTHSRTCSRRKQACKNWLTLDLGLWSGRHLKQVVCLIMYLRYLLLVCFFTKTLVSVDARPRNILADAFVNEDGDAYVANLTASDQADKQTLDQAYEFVIQSGIKVNRDDYANLAKSRYPSLYKQIVEFNRKSEDRENSLPEKVRQFILDRRAEVVGWFPNGEFDVTAGMRSIRLIDSDIAKMNAEEKTALFEYFPHMQELLANPHYKKIVEGSGPMVDELLKLDE